MKSTLPPSADVKPLVYKHGAVNGGRRAVPEETPVSLTYDGSAYAVMMATPADLTDFAIGFAFAEEIIESLSDIDTLEVIEVEGGIEARIWLKPTQSQRHFGRRRRIFGPTGCGLCGQDSIAEAIKDLPEVKSDLVISPGELAAGMAALSGAQELNGITRAVHAAGLWSRDKELIAREDVGRHNALDKAIGAAVSAGREPRSSAIFMTSRVSVELIQKAARFGAPILAAISAPTALAIRTAEKAGITIAAILRADGFEVFTHPHRISEGH
jgi:FdhD protein